MTTFILKPENGQIYKNLLGFLAQMPPKAWKVTIEEYSGKRSNPQNALYWKYLSIMGDHFGYTKDEMHEELASRFLGMVERKTLGGKQIIEPRSTTTLTKKEFSEYMDKIMALAIQQEITLPQPDYFGYDA
jgi:hypothetical protein